MERHRERHRERQRQRDRDRQTEKQRQCIPPLGPSVLEPGLDLGVRHLELFGQRGAFGGGQVLLAMKPLLQFRHLLATERGPRLLPLGWSAVLVGVAHPSDYWNNRENGGEVTAPRRDQEQGGGAGIS